MKHLEAITYQVIFPEKGLADFVSHFWHSWWNTGVQGAINYHSTANTSTELAFAFKPGKQPVFSTLQGHTANYSCIATGGLSEMFGVSLRSHAIPYFFEASAGELVNQLVELGDILGPDAEIITHRLANCDSFGRRVEIMSQYLKRKFNPNRKTDVAVIHAIRNIKARKGQVNIQTLAKESLLSQKQFERRFKDFSGFNPKLYSRISRFESAFPLYNDDTSLTNKALDLGYYDQAHFINDFRSMLGSTPGEYADAHGS